MLIMLLTVPAAAQVDDQKITLYRTWVSLNREPYKINAILYQSKDSSILLSSALEREDYALNNFEIAEIYIPDIEMIRIRKSNSILRGALIGSIAGFLAGGIIGLVSGDDPKEEYWFPMTAEEKALAGALAFGFAGANIGAGLGFIKLSIPIHGNQSAYQSNRIRLIERSVRKY